MKKLTGGYVKFKLLLVLAVLLAAPALTAGNSIDYSSGIFQSGTLQGSFTGSVNVNIVGSLNTIDFITGTLVKTTNGCPPGASCFDFTGGSVKVTDTSGTVFFDSLQGGIAVEENGAASIQAVLTDGHGITVGNATATFEFSGSLLSSGSANVSLQKSLVTPEPASMMLMGTGLIALAAKFRKRFIP